MTKRKAYQIFLFSSFFLMTNLKASSETKPFFGQKNQGLTFSSDFGLSRKLLDLFSSKTLKGTEKCRGFSLAYMMQGQLSNCALRHRVQITYNNHSQKDFRYTSLGWVPELLLGFEPAYFFIGIGPTLRTHKTPASGALFSVHFNLGIGLTHHSLSTEIFLKHLCNAGTGKPNCGQDSFGIGLSYLF